MSFQYEATVDAAVIHPLNYAATKMGMTVNFSSMRHGTSAYQCAIFLENADGFIEVYPSNDNTTWTLKAWQYNKARMQYRLSETFLREFLMHYRGWYAKNLSIERRKIAA